MPVNMDPSKKRRKTAATQETDEETAAESQQPSKALPDEPSDRDREHALADAEWKNLWDATEVIDMDKW